MLGEGGYDALSPDDKAKFDTAFKALLNSADVADLVDLANSTKLTSTQRAQIKAKFYEEF